MFSKNQPISNPVAIFDSFIRLGEEASRGQNEDDFPRGTPRVLGLESVKDAEGKVVLRSAYARLANLRQRALDVAILEINAKTDLKIKLVSIERSKHRRVVALNFTIKTQAFRTGPTRLN
jgi:Initiator Replication protein